MKPRVGVSACLVGEAVRYDGGHKQQQLILEQLPGLVDLVRVCPEAGAGLGIPRPAVQLVSINNTVRMLGVSDATLDVTGTIQSWIESTLAQFKDLDAFILKSRSPSCGSGSTPVFNEVGEILSQGSGLFAMALRETYPDIFIVEETTLQTREQIKAFMSELVSRPGKRSS